MSDDNTLPPRSTPFNKKPSKLASIGPLNSTTPQAILQWASSVKSAFDLIAGQTGDKFERRVSLRDLANLGLVSIGGGGGGNGNGFNLALPGGAFVSLSVDQFAQAIYGTKVFQALRKSLNDPTRFDSLSLPPEVLNLLQQNLADQAAQIGADIDQKQVLIQEQGRSLAIQQDLVTAAIEGAQAGVRKLVYAYTDANGAVAGQITTITTRLNNVNGDPDPASQVTIEEAFTAQSLTNGNLEGQYTLKIEAGGKIAGFGLANTGSIATGTTSAFIIQADKFAVVNSADSIPDPANPPADRLVFGVDTITGKVYIRGGLLVDAGGDSLDSLGQYKLIGSGTTNPSPTTSLKKNNLFLNTTNGITYRLDADAGTWQVYLQNGLRGSLTLQVSGSSWSDAAANAAVLAATGSSTNTIGDTVTISNGSTFADTRYWSGSAWISAVAVFNGNVIVQGTLAGAALAGTTIYGVTLDIGSGSVALPGQAAFHVSTAGQLYADSAFTQYLEASNALLPSANAILATSVGSVSTSHALQARHVNSVSTSGIVGAANGYDFYADGGGTNYGPFTGAHDALVPKGWTADIGDVVVDVRCIARAGVSNTIFEVAACTQEKRAGYVLALLPRALDAALPPAAMRQQGYGGVNPAGSLTWNQRPMAGFDDLVVTYDHIAMNSLGEGQMNVCGRGGDIAADDYITTSTMRGKGQRQNMNDGTADDTKRRYTVARAREACVFSTPDEVKMIACIYEGG